MSYHFTSNGDVVVTCPHGIVCDFVNTHTYIQGEKYVTGGDYWHDEETRCDAGMSPDGGAYGDYLGGQ